MTLAHAPEAGAADAELGRGHCDGGVVAWENSNRLLRRGQLRVLVRGVRGLLEDDSRFEEDCRTLRTIVSFWPLPLSNDDHTRLNCKAEVSMPGEQW